MRGEEPSSPKEISQENNRVFMDEMRGETIADVLCVLTAAAKICLESNQTQAALIYAEKAAELCKLPYLSCRNLVNIFM